MKLTKISLRRGLDRIIEPNFNKPKIRRWIHKNTTPYTLTPNYQLHKYSANPRFLSFPWVLSLFLGSFSAVLWIVYERQLNKNELDTIYRYRYHEQQVGSVIVYSRLLLMKMVLFIEQNYYLSTFFKKNKMGGSELDYLTEATIRYRQFKNFQQKKDRKYDFLELGVLQKFPYPKRQVTEGM